LAKGPRKPRFGADRTYPRHNERNTGGEKKRLLDIRRRKDFQYELDTLLDNFKVVENKSTIAATIQNKLSTRSYDDASEYADRLGEANGQPGEMATEIKRLMGRYSRWR